MNKLQNWSDVEDTAKELALIGSAAVPRLITALTDKRQYIAWAAAVALGMIGEEAKDAVPYLIKVFNKKTSFEPRAAALVSIGKIGVFSDGTIDLIIKEFNNNSPIPFQLQAAEVLGKIGLKRMDWTNRSIEILRSKQGKEDNIAFEVAILESLSSLGVEDIKPLLEIRKRILKYSLGDNDGEYRGQTLNRVSCYYSLAEIKDPYAVGVLIKAVLHAAYWEAPGDAAIALSKTNDEAAVPALVAGSAVGSQEYTWGRSRDEGIRTGLKNLGFTDLESTFPVLMKDLKIGKPQTRLLAIEAIGTFKVLSKKEIPALIQILKNRDENADIREMALRVLCWIGRDSVETIQAVSKILADRREGDVFCKVQGRWQSLRYTAAEYLNQEVRDARVNIDKLAKDAFPALISTLIRILETEDQEETIYYEVINLLDTIGPEAKDALPILRQIAEKAGKNYIRENALYAIEHIEAK
ncbi:MAG: HEAT repeat domain-containing protein [Candidatus Margulisiibacteriota bacterium]